MFKRMKSEFKKQDITDLNSVNQKKVTHYVYAVENLKIDFLYKPSKKSEGLLVMFHGARKPDATLPIFRGRRDTYKNCSLLSISDPVLEIYFKSHLLVSWYLDTNKFSITNHIRSIIEKVSSLSNQDNLLFFGTSGGGYPAIKYASIFNQGALLSNSPLYIDEHPYFEALTSILAQNGDALCEETRADGIIKKYGQPKYIILLTNDKDEHQLEYHTRPFVRFLKEAGMEKILDYHLFSGGTPKAGRDHHNIQYPDPYKNSFDLISTLIKAGFPPKLVKEGEK
jgi:hypothetical protein